MRRINPNAPAFCSFLLLALACAAPSPQHAAARLAHAIQIGDLAYVQQLCAVSGFNASDTIPDRSGRAVVPVEAAMNALQQYLALIAARGLGHNARPGAAAAVISSYLSIIELLTRHATADLAASCPLVLAVHYRIFPAISNFIAASRDRGVSCLLRPDAHGRTLLHVAAASKAAGLSSLLSSSHPLFSAPAEHQQSVDTLMSLLKLQRPAAPPSELLIRAPTLPRMNAILGAHELHCLIYESNLSPHHLNVCDGCGRAPLHVAASCANAAAVEALVVAGADVDARDHYSRTALHITCSNRLRNLSEYLLTASANPNLRDVDGNTALHLAAANHDAETFATLVRYGADVSILNNANLTACASAGVLRGPDLPAFSSMCGGSLPPHASCDVADAPVAYPDEASGGWGPAMNLPPARILPCPFEVIRLDSDVTSATFFSNFVSLQRPVIIKGLGLQTAASGLWTRDAFVQRWGALNVSVSALPHAQSYGQRSSTMSISAFVKLHMNTSRSSRAYVFDSRLLHAAPALRGSCPPPPLLQGARIVLSQFFIGPAASGSFPHFHGHALNTLVYGQKLWYIFPPNEAHFNVKSIDQWVGEDWPSIARRNLEAQRAGIAQCVQEAGDAVYVPQFWGHAVFNTAPSVGVAYEFDV
jgi:hypothetical protein